ncbi:MAG: dihydrolipoyl dehydrogenase [Clostridiaceae bacterium]|nr:dihydrolipoyl dehydrogenase [Clostridiaceae bacterium]
MRAIVIGGGPGGYVSAIRLAQLGAEVTLIEKEHIGGTCLNVGCIPTKVLLHTSEIFSVLKNEAEELGIEAESYKLNWNKLQERKTKIVDQLVNGVKNILKSYDIQIIIGEAKFLNEKEIEVSSNGSKSRLTFDKCIIATGSQPATAPIPGIETRGVITSTEALTLEEVPESLAIIGGGVIGCEIANVYSRLGTKVTIIEMLPNIIPNMEVDIVNVLKSKLEEEGIEIYTDSRVISIEERENMTVVKAEGAKGRFDVEAQKVLLSIGRKPVTAALGLENTKVETERGFIKTDKNLQTKSNNIYAIGDCKGGALLAHTASAEGVHAAEHIMNKKSGIDFKAIPYCVYTKPEIAGVGMTEKQAREEGYNVGTGIFPLYGNGKALIMGETYGIVKFVTDKDTDEILGLHMAGPRATELIVEGALAIRLEATIDEIVTTIHAHPTVGEALQEAAHAVYGNAIHLLKQ